MSRIFAATLRVTSDHGLDVAEFEREEKLVFGLFRKKVPIYAARIFGEFRVELANGDIVACEDGWLAFDARGHPYPIDADEFARSYDPADLRKGA